MLRTVRPSCGCHAVHWIHVPRGQHLSWPPGFRRWSWVLGRIPQASRSSRIKCLRGITSYSPLLLHHRDSACHYLSISIVFHMDRSSVTMAGHLRKAQVECLLPSRDIPSAVTTASFCLAEGSTILKCLELWQSCTQDRAPKQISCLSPLSPRHLSNDFT